MISFDNQTAAIITVRALSTRLPKKCFQKLYNNKSMLEIVSERAKQIGCRVIIATSEDDSDDEIENFANSINVDIFRGSLLNKIHRWHECYDHFKLSSAVIIDADDPSFSFSLMNRSLIQLQNSQKDMITGSENLMPGFMTYGFNRKGIEKLFCVARNINLDTDVINIFIDKAKLSKSIMYPENHEIKIDKIRLTVDYHEDVIFYNELFNKISYLSESHKMIEVIIEKKINTINWFRHEEFLMNQENFNKKISSTSST